MNTVWKCEGCKSVVRFNEDKPMNCFAQGLMYGLVLAKHATDGCNGKHYEDGHDGVSLEAAFLGAVEGKSYRTVRKEAEGMKSPGHAGSGAKPGGERMIGDCLFCEAGQHGYCQDAVEDGEPHECACEKSGHATCRGCQGGCPKCEPSQYTDEVEANRNG